MEENEKRYSLPKDLFNQEELEAIKNAGIDFDINKAYTDCELGELEIELKQACLDYGFTKCEPNEKCAMWEKICDDFIDASDNLID